MKESKEAYGFRLGVNRPTHDRKKKQVIGDCEIVDQVLQIHKPPYWGSVTLLVYYIIYKCRKNRVSFPTSTKVVQWKMQPHSSLGP